MLMDIINYVLLATYALGNLMLLSELRGVQFNREFPTIPQRLAMRLLFLFFGMLIVCLVLLLEAWND